MSSWQNVTLQNVTHGKSGHTSKFRKSLGPSVATSAVISCSSCAWKNGPIKLGNLNNYLPEKTIAIRFEAIASKVEAMAIRFEVIASKEEAMAIRFEAIASKVEAIASKVEAIAIRLEAIASRVKAIAIRLEAIAIRFEAIASKV